MQLEDNTFENSKVYLKVPYYNKDIVKNHGARWDPSRKMWYVHKNIPRKQLEAILSFLLSVDVPKYIYVGDEEKPTITEQFKLMQEWKKSDILKNYDENRPQPENITKSTFF